MFSSAASRQYLVAVVGGLALFVTGSSFTWATPLLPQLKSKDHEFQLTADQGSWVITLVEVGCLAPSIPAGFLADRFGRKTCLLYVTPVFILTWFMVIWWRSYAALCFMRFVQGMGVAIHYTILPIYLAEVAAPSRRGALANFFSVMWYLGFLFDYVVGTFFDYDGLTWFCIGPPIVFMIAFYFCPESPYFLMMNNRRGEASKALAWLENKLPEEIEPDLVAIEQSILEEKKNKGSWKDVTATPSGRKALAIILVMAMVYVLCGLSTLLSYVSEIFGTLSGNENSANLMSILAGAAVLVATIVSGFLSDRLGRRPIIIYFGGLSVLCLLVTGIFYYLKEMTDTDLTDFVWVPYVSIIFLMLTAPIAVGVIQALQGELFSNSTRGFAAGIYTLWVTFLNCVALKLYQVVGDGLGYYVNYIAFTVFTLAGVIYAFVFIPET
ncbi:facilitated trehalose transporter Tret1, partial [Halyomorpha halys]|uniref:facilitated trehalose transporter Tret1 n=1 Tax=Halyomorpha halys TaxID=286706 RepID=UPI0034D2FE77